MTLPTIKERQAEIVERYNALYNSKILSPTTQALLEDAICLLAEVLDDELTNIENHWDNLEDVEIVEPEVEYGLMWVPDEKSIKPQYTEMREDRARAVVDAHPDAYTLVRRRPAGEWLEVDTQAE